MAGKRTLNAVRDATKNLPTGANASEAYNYAYDEAMERIKNQGKDDEKLAKEILGWISFAERQLSLIELQEALAVKVGSTSLDTNDLYSLEDILSVCAGLVTHDPKSDSIRLVHYTTQQYFTRTKE